MESALPGAFSGGRIMNKRYWLTVVWAAVLVGAALSSGCNYMTQRGKDALEMIDVGLTVSAKPGFAFYPGDYFNYTPIGYSSVDGWYLGWAHAQAGCLRFKDESWGLLLWGSEHLRIGEFNPNDPHLFDQAKLRELKEAGQPIPTESPQYNVGAVSMSKYGNKGPWPSFVSCRRNFHFGFIGIHASMHPADIADFFLGWTTYDLMDDDNVR
jgi:hypothetical protein